MLVVMELHRFRVDVRLERVVAEPSGGSLCAMSRPPRSRHRQGWRRVLNLVDGLGAGSWTSSTFKRASVALRSGWVCWRTHRGGLALERYDLVIVGGGAAGINALKAAVTMTARVVLVDRGPLGGTCVNLG